MAALGLVNPLAGLARPSWILTIFLRRSVAGESKKRARVIYFQRDSRSHVPSIHPYTLFSLFLGRSSFFFFSSYAASSAPSLLSISIADARRRRRGASHSDLIRDRHGNIRVYISDAEISPSK